MRKLPLLVLLLSTQGVLAQSLQDGIDAKNAGDYETALAILRPIAEQGEAEAQYQLGVVYRYGPRVIWNNVEAAKWYRLAAEQGVVVAQRDLGQMYYHGSGVIQDYTEALRLYRLAVAGGDRLAQHLLAEMYANGVGLERDNVRAHMWYNIASSLGWPSSGGDRDLLAESMTREQIAEAQRLARECVANNYKDC